MKKLFCLIVFCVLTAGGYATVKSTQQMADSLYGAKDFLQATAYYRLLAAEADFKLCYQRGDG